MVSKIVFNMDMINNIWKIMIKKMNMMKILYVRVLCEFCYGFFYWFCIGDNGIDGF